MIADHYGLLIVGWSGSDPALAGIIRERTQRYGGWWLSRREEPAEPARTLIETMAARLIVRPGAGEFLGELERRLAVYDSTSPVTTPGRCTTRCSRCSGAMMTSSSTSSSAGSGTS